MSGARCSTCGADVGGRAICSHCGTLLGVERGVAKVRSSIRAYVAARMQALPRRLTINHFLWLCAVMPVFVLPPLASLAFAVVSLKKKGNTAPGLDSEWLAIVSLLNVVLSLLLLYKLHFSPVEVAAFFRDLVESLLRSIFHVVPGNPPKPRVIPI
jgi:hypothetical protein